MRIDPVLIIIFPTLSLASSLASPYPIGTSDPTIPKAYKALQGIVAGPPRQADFFLRADGYVYLVRPHSPRVLSAISGGDKIRIYGAINGLNVTNANVRVVQSRTSGNWDDYGPAPR